jgi:hypothetical protein
MLGLFLRNSLQFYLCIASLNMLFALQEARMYRFAQHGYCLTAGTSREFWRNAYSSDCWSQMLILLVEFCLSSTGESTVALGDSPADNCEGTKFSHKFYIKKRRLLSPLS